MPVCVLDLLCLCQVPFSQQTYEVDVDSNEKEPHTLRDVYNKKFIFFIMLDNQSREAGVYANHCLQKPRLTETPLTHAGKKR